MGSLKYMPPEVLLGHYESTPKIDVWAIGVMLHALVLGYFPFRSSNKEDLKKQILEKEIVFDKKLLGSSEQCIDLMLRMLEKDPAKRLTVSEILDHPWLCEYRKQKKRSYYGIFGSELCLTDNENENEEDDDNSKLKRRESTGHEYSDEFTNEEAKTPTTNVDDDHPKSFSSPNEGEQNNPNSS